MANRDFLPHANAELLAWSSNFSQMIVATLTAFGLVAAQSTAYQTLHDGWAALLSTATEPSTRTRGSISAANDGRVGLKAMARELARVINAFPAITRQTHALPVPPSPVPPSLTSDQ